MKVEEKQDYSKKNDETSNLLTEIQESDEVNQRYSHLDDPGRSKLYLWLMFFYGVGNLLPNMAILTDMDYFIHKYSSIGKHPEFVYNMVINFSFVIGQTVGIRLILRFNYLTRLLIVLIPMIFILIAFPFLIQYTEIDASWDLSIFIMVLIVLLLFALLDGYACYLLILKMKMAIFTQLQCILLQTSLYKQPYVLHYLYNIYNQLILKVFLNSRYFQHYLQKRKGIPVTQIQTRPITIANDQSQQSIGAEENQAKKSSLHDSIIIFKKIWVEAVFIFLNFAITFLIYPSITYQGGLNIYNSPEWSIFIYNLSYSVGDFSGRTLGRIKHSYPRPFFVIGTFCRLILIASTFIMAYYHDNVFWGNAGVIILNSFILGISGGFFGVCCGNSFPGKLEDNEKEFGGFIISCMINIGIAIGSLISLVGFQDLF
ncbi:equilibrative nucleoside transporter [Stylonychia lemnae]|uniref:Equilibrative nucleoside transporter n=1 Tax=Stylonychia lemnae TaxID=5949 RepID=A0A078BAS8_STYLE|nr:equilibrative nucleoside transporter [Stylonychia lemnae]|eukprot:CDW90668.1 equilibrative nucleoside transporter [Stylonychia lemnae]